MQPAQCSVNDNNCEGPLTKYPGANWLCASHRGFAYVLHHQHPDDPAAPRQLRRFQYTKDLEDMLKNIINDLDDTGFCCADFSAANGLGHMEGCFVWEGKALLERTDYTDDFSP